MLLQLLLNQRGLALLEKGNLMQIFYHQGTMIVKVWYLINPFTPISDQDRISPYNINTISSGQEMRMKKNISYRNFRSFTRTADYPHRPIIAYGEKRSHQITRTGG